MRLMQSLAEVRNYMSEIGHVVSQAMLAWRCICTVSKHELVTHLTPGSSLSVLQAFCIRQHRYSALSPLKLLWLEPYWWEPRAEQIWIAGQGDLIWADFHDAVWKQLKFVCSNACSLLSTNAVSTLLKWCGNFRWRKAWSVELPHHLSHYLSQGNSFCCRLLFLHSFATPKSSHSHIKKTARIQF